MSTQDQRRNEMSLSVGIGEICLIIIAVCVLIATFKGWNAF
jgi:hypothetical protein